jgi:hypothetical protein
MKNIFWQIVYNAVCLAILASLLYAGWKIYGGAGWK